MCLQVLEVEVMISDRSIQSISAMLHVSAGRVKADAHGHLQFQQKSLVVRQPRPELAQESLPP